MIETFKTFEKFYLVQKNFPDYMDFSPENFDKLLKNFDTGCCFPLMDRDSDGSRILVYRIPLWDLDNFSPQDAVRLLLYISMTLSEEEETQIAGISIVTDFSGISTRHILPPMEIMRLLNFFLSCDPVRVKKIYAINVPKFAKWVLDLALPRLKDKFKFRFFMIDSMSDLVNYFDEKMLPKEFGGVKSCSEILESFKNVIEERKEIVLKSLRPDIDWSKVLVEETGDEEGVGIFRKLEID